MVHYGTASELWRYLEHIFIYKTRIAVISLMTMRTLNKCHNNLVNTRH